MASRKRSGSGSKRPKEKVVYIYELLFRGEDPVNNNNEFWDSFFLLQPNVESLENELTKLSNDQLLLVKGNIKLLFVQSIQMLESGRCVFFKLNQLFVEKKIFSLVTRNSDYERRIYIFFHASPQRTRSSETSVE